MITLLLAATLATATPLTPKHHQDIRTPAACDVFLTNLADPLGTPPKELRSYQPCDAATIAREHLVKQPDGTWKGWVGRTR